MSSSLSMTFFSRGVCAYLSLYLFVCLFMCLFLSVFPCVSFYLFVCLFLPVSSLFFGLSVSSLYVGRSVSSCVSVSSLFVGRSVSTCVSFCQSFTILITEKITSVSIFIFYGRCNTHSFEVYTSGNVRGLLKCILVGTCEVCWKARLSTRRISQSGFRGSVGFMRGS